MHAFPYQEPGAAGQHRGRVCGHSGAGVLFVRQRLGSVYDSLAEQFRLCRDTNLSWRHPSVGAETRGSGPCQPDHRHKMRIWKRCVRWECFNAFAFRKPCPERFGTSWKSRAHVATGEDMRRGPAQAARYRTERLTRKCSCVWCEVTALSFLPSWAVRSRARFGALPCRCPSACWASPGHHAKRHRESLCVQIHWRAQPRVPHRGWRQWLWSGGKTC